MKLSVFELTCFTCRSLIDGATGELYAQASLKSTRHLFTTRTTCASAPPATAHSTRRLPTLATRTKVSTSMVWGIRLTAFATRLQGRCACNDRASTALRGLVCTRICPAVCVCNVERLHVYSDCGFVHESAANLSMDRCVEHVSFLLEGLIWLEI